MVGPVSEEEREVFVRRIKYGFVLLVALSAVLITLQTGAGTVGLLTAGGAGVVFGALLLWLAFP